MSYLFWTALLNIINGVALIMAYTVFAPTKTLNTVACGLNTVATTIASLWLISGVVMFLAAWGYSTIDFQWVGYLARIQRGQRLLRQPQQKAETSRHSGSLRSFVRATDPLDFVLFHRRTRHRSHDTARVQRYNDATHLLHCARNLVSLTTPGSVLQVYFACVSSRF